jgi:hypothetical protein
VLLSFRRVKKNSVIRNDDDTNRTNIFITGGARRLAVRAARVAGSIFLACWPAGERRWAHPEHLRLRVGVVRGCIVEEAVID